MLRILAVAVIFVSAVQGMLPESEILGLAPETVASLLIALLLAPTIGRLMD